MSKYKLKYTIVNCGHCNGSGSVSIVDAESLRQARIASGISRVKLAIRLGLTENYLWKCEHGIRRCTPKIEKAYSEL